MTIGALKPVIEALSKLPVWGKVSTILALAVGAIAVYSGMVVPMRLEALAAETQKQTLAINTLSLQLAGHEGSSKELLTRILFVLQVNCVIDARTDAQKSMCVGSIR